MPSRFEQWVDDVQYFQKLVGMQETDINILRRDWRRLTLKAKIREADRASNRLAQLFAGNSHIDEGRNVDPGATTVIHMSIAEDFAAYDKCPSLVRIAVAYAPVSLSSALSYNVYKSWGERYAAQWIIHEMSMRYPGYACALRYDLPAGYRCVR